ncbi:MAG: caspase family protein [candidate division WOR-3 bacterium]|nr:caspase family protein [candidate division WOR-3 bacterium]
MTGLRPLSGVVGRQRIAVGSRHSALIVHRSAFHLTLLGIALLATAIPAADFSLGGSIGAGYANWLGWDGYVVAFAGGPTLGFGRFDLGADFLLARANVPDMSWAIRTYGGLAKVRFGVFQVGAGYGYIPGFTNETGAYYTGSGSPLLSLGVAFPLRLTDRVSLTLGAENIFATRPAGLYGPSAQLGLAYCFTKHKEVKRPVRPAPTPPSKVAGPVAGPAPKPGPKLSFPPRLETVLAFEETGRRNQALDAGEQAYIVVTVANKGKGKADSVRVRAEAISSVTGVSVSRDAIIPEISAGGTEQVKVRLAANEDAPDQEVRFRVSAIEPVFGADALPAVITITARGIEPPELAVHDFAITDKESESEWAQGNGNGQLELNEQVEVTTIVQNRGTGTALGVQVTVTPTDPNVLYQSSQPVLNLGDIPAGEWRSLKYPVFVNARYKGDTVKLALSIAEQRPKFTRTATVAIPMNTRVQAPTEVAIQPKPRPDGTSPTQPPSLTDSLLVGIPQGGGNPDAIAVVIGVSNYKSVSKVEYAKRDAEAMRKYLTEAFGYSDGNVIVLDDPSKGDLERTFGTAGNPEGQLFNWASRKPGQCDVFVYYVGHGAPSIREKKGYLVPADASPDYIEINGYPLDAFYANLGKVPAKSLTVVLDACFSGETPDVAGNVTTFLRDASPLVVAPVTEDLPANATVMTAASGSQIASWYPDKRHGLFTYYLLKGLKGEADADGSGAVKLRELQQYVSTSVSPMARALYNREQTPEFRGSANAEVLRLR